MNRLLHIVFATCIALLLQKTARAEMVSFLNQECNGIIIADDSLRADVFQTTSPSDSAANFHKEKLIAAILSFPVPFGFTGLHRIYLGSDPWIPVVYLITGGGGFGLVPLIDFIFIVTADEEEFRKYENNSKLFMWVE